MHCYFEVELLLDLSCPLPLFCDTRSARVQRQDERAVDLLLHGTMQCEVKSKVARPQPSSITPDPGFVVHCYSREGRWWRFSFTANCPSHMKAESQFKYCFRVVYVPHEIMPTPIPTWASTSGYRGPIADGATEYTEAISVDSPFNLPHPVQHINRLQGTSL